MRTSGGKPHLNRVGEYVISLWRELTHAFILEGSLLILQLTNGIASLLMTIIEQPFYHNNGRSRLVADKHDMTSAQPSNLIVRLLGFMSFFFPPLATMVESTAKNEGVYREVISKPHVSFVNVINLGCADPKVDMVHDYEIHSTGFFEDLQHSAMLTIDYLSESFCLDWACSRQNMNYFLINYSREMNRSISSLWDQSKTINVENIGEDPVKKILATAGYPYEKMKVTTDDGYILEMQRIPRKDSKKVMYFQHGLVDSSSAFLATGSICGLAYSAYDKGYDVFLGNFRGSGPSNHANENLSESEYWNYSINEFGLMDMPAFVKKIMDSKAVDTDNNMEGLEITVVGHSLGATALLMYITDRKNKKIPHFISRGILLSPAGYHGFVPLPLRFLLVAIEHVINPMIKAYVLPRGYMKVLLSKIIQDIRKLPSMLDITSWVTCSVLGGSFRRSMVRVVDFGRYELFGASKGVMLHGVQLWKSGRFQLFDYGSAGNLKEYNQNSPPDVLASFGHIDVPLYFLAGGQDQLIPAENIIHMYETLSKHRPDLAHLKVFPDLNHVDFTLSPDQDLLDYVNNLF